MKVLKRYKTALGPVLILDINQVKADTRKTYRIDLLCEFNTEEFTLFISHTDLSLWEAYNNNTDVTDKKAYLLAYMHNEISNTIFNHINDL